MPSKKRGGNLLSDPGVDQRHEAAKLLGANSQFVTNILMEHRLPAGLMEETFPLDTILHSRQDGLLTSYLLNVIISIPY